MSRARVYIGELSSRATEADVSSAFSRYGRLDNLALKDGFGFVTYDNERDAEDAVRGEQGDGDVHIDPALRPPILRGCAGARVHLVEAIPFPVILHLTTHRAVTRTRTHELDWTINSPAAPALGVRPCFVHSRGSSLASRL